ncbi:hypothetical protein [Burkholderia arboris]|uniref:hypothetical protein n=1 Tax=Burkholderia arboris TaxID=488730 RepID=UPI001CF2CCFC|nr:hypothetical protein [Burkholderia arboris]MCA8050805.1 hypothetical protein [Burkholderia arboris]HEP6430804.1 hypothetical protein [Burkholderia cenocepacia]
MAISLDAAKAIYRRAIDTSAGDAEGAAWWEEVADEVRDVVAARSVSEAAEIIEWWHRDWATVADTARSAAKRIRDAAREFRRQGVASCLEANKDG